MNLFDECHRLFSYDAETGLLTRKVNVGTRAKIGSVVGTITHGYLVVEIQGKPYSLHRLIWLMVTGILPVVCIDHINGIKADNRWVNLREATKSENSMNRGKTKLNATGFKGVWMSGNKKNPYRAKIVKNGKRIHLGRYPTPELAYQAYCQASKELHGEFANNGAF